MVGSRSMPIEPTHKHLTNRKRAPFKELKARGSRTPEMVNFLGFLNSLEGARTTTFEHLHTRPRLQTTCQGAQSFARARAREAGGTAPVIIVLCDRSSPAAVVGHDVRALHA